MKKELYQGAGVPKYWIADPIETRLEQFVLATDVYHALEQAAVLRQSVLPEVTVDLEKVW